MEKAESLSDYAVSSYTPTIRALMDDTRPPTNSFKMMVVIQPEAPDQQPLPWTHKELRQIEAHVPDKESLIKLLHGSVKEVISHLPTASIAHFACHGQQNWRNPLESALSLYDDQLKVSQIMQQSMPNASLAFLSACETAMGDENLPDEVIHLGATLLFTGFHGVVATLWCVILVGSRLRRCSDHFSGLFMMPMALILRMPSTNIFLQVMRLDRIPHKQLEPSMLSASCAPKRFLSYVGYPLFIWEGDSWRETAILSPTSPCFKFRTIIFPAQLL